ncbi:MAG: capsular biosynthesis protein [Cytophagaceae bacterium]|nr:capsular biosynthesis protein [Cytophagaceae bacterium]MDW8456905.1 CpsB/CapC family capsule biosynthesis tyrosine phosphatase [Cytophagaceae bacterium]
MKLSQFFSICTKSKHECTLTVDVHSHLLPGIDDGAANIQESITLVKNFIHLGYKKLIMTPHIIEDYYKNTPEIIHAKLAELQSEIKKHDLDISLEAAAEYYLDEFFVKKIHRSEPLLFFGNKYLLFETSFMNPSSYFSEAVFSMKAAGYNPVLAHPERYVYLYDDFNKYKEIKNLGILFQINIASLSGYYSEASRKIAEKLINENMIDFLGSDCHASRHIEAIAKAQKTKAYEKALSSNLLNYTL